MPGNDFDGRRFQSSATSCSIPSSSNHLQQQSTSEHSPFSTIHTAADISEVNADHRTWYCKFFDDSESFDKMNTSISHSSPNFTMTDSTVPSSTSGLHEQHEILTAPWLGTLAEYRNDCVTLITEHRRPIHPERMLSMCEISPNWMQKRLTCFRNRHECRRAPAIQCPERGCPESFRYAKDLRRHLNSNKHAALKSFFCPEASCEFFWNGSTRKDNITRHMRKKHPDSAAAVIDLGNNSTHALLGCVRGSSSSPSCEKIKVYIPVEHSRGTPLLGALVA